MEINVLVAATEKVGQISSANSVSALDGLAELGMFI